MSKSRWKLNHFNNFLYKKILHMNVILIDKNKNNSFTLFNKNLVIPIFNNNVFFKIHKGNVFKYFQVSKLFAGYKVGNFCFTKKPFYFPQKKKKSGKR